MARDDLRLRVELNSMIKFYITTHQSSSLDDLKRTINSILRLNYNIAIPSYAIRSSDGFEVLDVYTVGDVLEDNQVVVLDPLASMHLNSNKKRLSPKLPTRESIETETPRPAQTVEKTPRKGRVTISESQPVPVQSITEKISSHSVLEKANEPTVASNQKKAEKTEETQKETTEPEKKTEEAIQREEPAPIPPRPDNFKGFIVNKADLTKPQGVRIDESSFKPLKKRRIDGDGLELEL